MSAKPAWVDCGIDCAADHSDDGFIQKYVHLTRELEAPASFHVFSLLATVAAATRRRVVIDRGAYRLWPNLYVLLHGPSGLGKSVAADNTIGLVRMAGGEMAFKKYAEDTTVEGLMRVMHEQTEANEGAIGFLFGDEFGDLLGGQEYKAELAKRLTRIYACPDGFAIARSQGERAERELKHVFLTILSCSQEDWLRTLPIHAIKGGLFARILVVPETAVRHRRFEAKIDIVAAQALVDELGLKLAAIGDGGVITMTAAAKELGKTWYDGEDERRRAYNQIVMPWCERRMDHAIKLAYLNSLLEGDMGPLIIDEDGLQWGLQVVEWLTPRIESAFLRMNETMAGEIHRTIVEMVGRNGDTVLERSIRAGLGSRYTKSQMDSALDHLVLSGAIRRFDGADSRGRLATYIKRHSEADE